MLKPLRGFKTMPILSGSLTSRVERCLQKVGSKFRGSHRGANNKGQKECVIAIGLGPWGEEFGLPLKVTLFFSIEMSLGPAGMLSSSDAPQLFGSNRFLVIYSKIMQKKSIFFKF